MSTAQDMFPRVARNTERVYWFQNFRVSLAAGLLLLLVLAGAVWVYPLWFVDRVTQAKIALAGMHGQEVMIEGHRIHYLVGGQGEPVVLVHGLGSRATDWADLIPSIVHSGHRVYAIDLLGYGESERPRDGNYSIAEEAKIVEGFLDQEGLKQVDLAGWSMGGWISMVVASDRPEQISKLVLLDSAGLRFQPTFDPLLFTPSNLKELHQLVKLLTPQAKPVPDFLAKALLVRSQKDSWVIRRSVTSMLTGQNLLDGKLQDLKMPVLIVWGKQDVLTPLSMAEQLHQGLPKSTLDIYDGCGHLAPGLCAKRIAPDLLAFLDNGSSQDHARLLGAH